MPNFPQFIYDHCTGRCVFYQKKKKFKLVTVSQSWPQIWSNGKPKITSCLLEHYCCSKRKQYLCTALWGATKNNLFIYWIEFKCTALAPVENSRRKFGNMPFNHKSERETRNIERNIHQHFWTYRKKKEIYTLKQKKRTAPGFQHCVHWLHFPGKTTRGQHDSSEPVLPVSSPSGTWNLPYSGNRLMVTHMKLKQRFWAEGTDVLAQLFGISV